MSKLLNRAKVKMNNALNDYNLISNDDAYLDDCCYNLQQAIEMTLKFLVELQGSAYVMNHDILAQLNTLRRLEINIPYYDELRHMAVTLNSWEAESRYKDNFCAVMEDIDAAILYAKELISFADSKIKQNDCEVKKIASF